MEDLRCIAGPDDSGHAQFAADDGRVRGAAAVIGDDGGSALHDRHPVRVGRPRHQNCTVDEAIHIAGAIDQARSAGNDRLTDAEA